MNKKSKVKKAKQSRGLPLGDIRWRPVAEIVERLFPHIGTKILIAHDLTEAVRSEKIRCMRRVATDGAPPSGIKLEQQVLGAALLNQSFEVTLSAEQFSFAPHRQIFETIARVRASHAVITPQLIIDSMGGDAGETVIDGITMGQYVEVLAAEATLPCDVPGHRELMPASFWVEHCFTYSNGDVRVGVRPPNHLGTWTLAWMKKSAFYLWQPDCEKAWPALAPLAAAAREADAIELLRGKPGPRATAEWQWFVAMTVCTQKYLGKSLPTAGELAELCQTELGYQPAETAINKLRRDLLRLLG